MTTGMKRLFSLIWAIVLLCPSVVSCSVTNAATSTTNTHPTYSTYSTYLPYNPQPKVGYVTTIRSAVVFQTLEEHFALANWTCYYGSDTRELIVAIRCDDTDSPMYDGRVLGGDFVMVETYNYTTYPDELGRTFSKTVPVVVPKEDYLKTLKK